MIHDLWYPFLAFNLFYYNISVLDLGCGDML